MDQAMGTSYRARPAWSPLPAFARAGIEHRALIWRLGVRGVQERYQGSVLGVAWLVLSPLLLLGAYTLVFGVVLGARYGATGRGDRAAYEYAVWLFAGVVLFQFLSACLNEAPNQLRKHRALVTRVVFPLECLAYVRVVQALLEMTPGLVLLMGMTVLVHGVPPATALLLPLAVLPLALLALASLWLFSSLGAFIRDLAPLIGTGTLALMFLSAVFYPIHAVPEPARTLIGLNPIARALESARWMLFATGDPGAWWLAGSGVAAAVLCVLAHAWFVRTKGAVADVL